MATAGTEVAMKADCMKAIRSRRPRSAASTGVAVATIECCTAERNMAATALTRISILVRCGKAKPTEAAVAVASWVAVWLMGKWLAY